MFLDVDNESETELLKRLTQYGRIQMKKLLGLMKVISSINSNCFEIFAGRFAFIKFGSICLCILC